MKIIIPLSILIALQQTSCADARKQKKADKRRRGLKGSKSGKGVKGGKSGKSSKGSTTLKPIPVDMEEEWGEPDWLKIIEGAFPPWELDGDCAALEAIGGTTLAKEQPNIVGSTEGKFNPCYYTKRFAGLNPDLGGYPTPIDTKYPYEFAAPFLSQPGDGSVHHCKLSDPFLNEVDIGSCPKLGADCGKDCATITNDYGIGHIPPFVPLAAVKMAYNSGEYDICNDWFNEPLNGCSIKKDSLDEIVYKYFGEGDTVKFRPPILLEGEPSDTYYKLEYIGDPSAGEDSESKGPHYCTKETGNPINKIWGDFCPYISTGENSGKYRHPHLALAAFELWIANQCMPDSCPLTWLDSPNGENYASDYSKTTNIIWCEMEDNDNSMSQPKVPYKWPIEDDLATYDDRKRAEGSYVTKLVSDFNFFGSA